LALRRAAAAILTAGLEAADPARLVRRQLSRRRDIAVTAKGRLVVVAAGKASAAMAAAAEQALGGRISEGLLVGPVPVSPPGPRWRVHVAGHPVPDARGLEAASDLERLASRLDRKDLLLVLLSGGASALLPAPVDGLSLADKAAATALLLRSGATIHELNTVRKHLSRLKGGGLARAAAPARVVCLVLSDVVGDDPATIASGPTAPDPTTYADAVRVLDERGLREAVPASVRDHLEAGVLGRRPETPKPGDPLFRRVQTRIIGSNRLCLAAAAREARRQGLRPVILTSRLEGEAREVARVLVAVLRECIETAHPAAPPVCLLAGGETTVTVRGDGHGGRNQELAVAAVEPLAEFTGPAVVASLATDGIDGRSEAAGGVADDASLGRARAMGLAPPANFLAHSDSRGFLAPLGDLLITGPTGTNVVDLVALLAGPRSAAL
jgi:hydroxypyruvate reductase